MNKCEVIVISWHAIWMYSYVKFMYVCIFKNINTIHELTKIKIVNYQYEYPEFVIYHNKESKLGKAKENFFFFFYLLLFGCMYVCEKRSAN